MTTPKLFIQSIRETFGTYPQSSAGCWRFANILSSLYGGKIYYNNEHFITLINGYYYDIYGEYGEDAVVRYIFEGELKEFPISDFLPIESFGIKNIMNSFR